MSDTNKWKNRKDTRQVNSSEPTVNTREGFTMGQEANDPMTEVPTIETMPDAEITSDTIAMPDTEATPDTDVTTDVEITPDTEALSQSRSLDEIRDEFRSHYQRGAESVYRMGELLNEAKSQLPEHLKWLDWLYSVNFPERQAQRLMKLAKGYPDPTTLSELGQSKALALLKVDENERNEFIEEAHMVFVRGVKLPTSVHEMSVRQLEGAIREHNGTSKKKAQPKSTSQSYPLMAHDDTLEASESERYIDGSFEHIHLCLDSLIDFIEGLEDSSDERDDLTDKLRELLDEALQRIVVRTGDNDVN